MLVQQVRINDTIDIGSNIRVMVTDIIRQRNSGALSVRIGIQAPEEINIRRMELLRIDREQKDSE